MAIVVDKARPVATRNQAVDYAISEADIHLSTVNTDKLALFQFNQMMRATDDLGLPDTGIVFPAGEVQVTHNGQLIYYGGDWVTYTP